MHLQNGGQQIPEYGKLEFLVNERSTLLTPYPTEELLKKFYAGGHTQASIMQFLEDRQKGEDMAARLDDYRRREAQKNEAIARAQEAQRAEQARAHAAMQAQAQAQAQAAAAGSPGQNLFDTPPRSPFSQPSPRGSF